MKARNVGHGPCWAPRLHMLGNGNPIFGHRAEVARSRTGYRACWTTADSPGVPTRNHGRNDDTAQVHIPGASRTSVCARARARARVLIMKCCSNSGLLRCCPLGHPLQLDQMSIWQGEMNPAGLEPAIPGSVGRCIIHWATGP